MEIENLVEEVFCLRFELNSLSEVLIKQESERWLPNFSLSFVENDHVARYELACNYVSGADVLDLACGAGKGSYLLSETGKAKSIVGGDINQDALRYAKHRYPKPNIAFEYINGIDIPHADSFDTIVCFETIEHVKNYEALLTNLHKALRLNGTLLISTPVSKFEEDLNPVNPYHTIEWGFEAFQKLVKRYFTVSEVYVQLYPKYNSLPHKSIVERVINKILRNRPAPIEQPAFISKLEKFNGQFPLNEIGTDRVGYQILVCKKEL